MEASCTWGDGPDVLVEVKGTNIVLYHDPIGKDRWTHGIISEGSFDMTADEALRFADKLIFAARQAKEIDQSVADYFEKEKELKMDEIKQAFADIEAGKPMKIKRTQMRILVKDGVEDYDNKEIISVTHETISMKKDK